MCVCTLFIKNAKQVLKATWEEKKFPSSIGSVLSWKCSFNVDNDNEWWRQKSGKNCDDEIWDKSASWKIKNKKNRSRCSISMNKSVFRSFFVFHFAFRCCTFWSFASLSWRVISIDLKRSHIQCALNSKIHHARKNRSLQQPQRSFHDR